MRDYFRNWKSWPRKRPVIIAEVGVNHGGNEHLAWDMIRSAHRHGADFVKLQSFITEDFFHPSLPYFLATKALELSFESQRMLFKKAHKQGIRLITTPFDFASVDMIEEFDPPAYKIASMDNNNISLIRYIARKGRPIFISCGMATLYEIKKAIEVMREEGNNKFILLHCVSNYPAEYNELNLSMIGLLRDKFNCPVGFSDHSIGLFASYLAIFMGATAVEKHFTTDRSLAKRFPEADHAISIEPDELQNLKEFREAVPVMIGMPQRMLNMTEKAKRK